jgi:hypothetical protein
MILVLEYQFIVIFSGLARAELVAQTALALSAVALWERHNPVRLKGTLPPFVSITIIEYPSISLSADILSSAGTCLTVSPIEDQPLVP